ncbi:hypothetical protein ADL19_14815 [Streptomyces purpurogeneiscleroticus]|nr:hypothetical protein ADL19_14815 [Streptomyces purpurogeneiscleroticus]
MNAFKVETPIKAELIADMVIGAFEGGITYWCAKARPVEPCEDCVTYEDKCPWYARTSLYEGDFKIRLQQHEEHKPGAGVDVFMTVESVQKGLNLMAEKYPEHFSNMVSGNWDAETADVFVQLCVFGDIIYG